MKKINKIILSLFFIHAVMTPVLAETDSMLEPVSEIQIHNEPKTNNNENYFNLSNIVDNFQTQETQDEIEAPVDKKAQIRTDFVSITSKFNQGNAKVAYDEYEELIDKIENDNSLLNLSKIFYEIGFFSLADKANQKIVNTNKFQKNIENLEKSYKPKSQLTKDEEIYFAKMYSNIYFDNSASETVSELLEKKNRYQKNDFYNFTLARAYFELKQYNSAINSINKTISQNPSNTSYQMLKTDILIAAKKYKDAKNSIERTKKEKLTLNFIPKLEIQEQSVLSNLSKNDKEKKYYSANKNFLEGNFEKAKKDCRNILNFDKDNDKIISLYAKSELALGNIERANSHFVNAYKIEKNNIDTLIGLGDIRYLHGDYKNSVKMYKKALKLDKNNYETIIKLENAQRQYARYPKEIKKLEALLDKMPENAYLAYYKSAISIAQKNDVLKETFLNRTLDVNPMYENALGELIELYLKNKNYRIAKNLIYSASFTLEKNYYYYYLCGLYNQAVDKRRDAIEFYKTSLSLNPNFEIANTKLLKLIPNKQSEEI